MESSEFYSELKAKGLLLANHDGKLRVWPKEKLTKGDRELLKLVFFRQWFRRWWRLFGI
jgi:hypothetical protein